MKAGVLKETYPGERRVALVPGSLAALQKAGLEILVEHGAGLAAGFPDALYREKGATLASRAEIFQQAELLLMVRAAGANPEVGPKDLPAFRAGQFLVAHADPLSEPVRLRELAERGVNVFALELLPRITRAQSMDVLSSMATVAGYQAVLLAATTLPRMFPMLMTAAGTVTPAKVFIMGAGVAGLQAIATARRLGARVRAYDIREAVREQVESLGAQFVVLDLSTGSAEGTGGYAKEMGEEFYRRQRELMAAVIADCDVVITTAAVPGRKAPILVTKEMIAGMAPGSVIVDLAAERGGNCELTRPGETVEVNGVTILGPVNLPATIPYHASEMYSKNVTTFLLNLVKQGQLQLNPADEIHRETLVTRDGQVIHPRVRELLQLPPLPQPTA